MKPIAKLKEAAKAPAPRWYRKMNSIVSLASGPTMLAFLEIFDPNDSQMAKYGKIMAFLPTILEIFRIVLTNGETYATAAKNTSIVVMLVLLGGCYTEHKATRQVIKAKTYYPERLEELAAVWYPIKIMRKDSISYVPGPVVYKPGAIPKPFDCDSAIKAATAKGKPQTSFQVPCIPDTITRVDTFFKSTNEVQESTIAVQAEKSKAAKIQKDLDAAKIKIATQAQTNKWLWWAVIVLGCYTLLRWILRMIWGIKLP